MRTPQAKKLPSGAWTVRVQINGERVQITRETKKAAEEEAVRRKLESDPDRISGTLGDAMKAYIESRRQIISPSTLRGYSIIVRNHLQDLQRLPISQINAKLCQIAINAECRTASAKTVQNVWRFTKSAIYYATGKRIEIELPQRAVKPKKYLAPDQIETFVAAVHNTTVEIPALLALSSLRCSEILDLKWECIDTTNGTISVCGAAVPGEDGKLVHKRETKNITSTRTVPIIPPLRAALDAVGDKSGYIVTMTESGIYKGVNRVCRAAGLPEVGVHGLRHSFASLAYHLGIPLKIAQRIGGWADSKTMMDIYTHIADKEVAKSADKISQFFQNGDEMVMTE